MGNVRLDRSGVAALLKSSGVASEISSTAGRVADAVRADAAVARHSMPVSTASGVSDRARSIVTIMHAGGLGVQAKHGSLSRAVASTGLAFKGAAS